MAMSAAVTDNSATDSKLRAWLQDALQLQGRVTFGSGVDAVRAFRDVLPPREERALEALSLQTAIRQLYGESAASADEESLPHQRAS
jgi:hypothetical protein